MEFIPCRCLFRAKKVAASAVTLAAIWRSGRDSNPRAVARKLISRGIVCKISSQNLIKINISLLEVLFWRANLYFLLQKYFLLYKALTIARHQLGTIKLLGDLNTWMCS